MRDPISFNILVIPIKELTTGLRDIVVVSYSANSSSNDSCYLGGIPSTEVVRALPISVKVYAADFNVGIARLYSALAIFYFLYYCCIYEYNAKALSYSRSLTICIKFFFMSSFFFIVLVISKDIII